jgi:hypothetical protein
MPTWDNFGFDRAQRAYDAMEPPDRKEATPCDVCGEDLDEDNCCTSPWCTKCDTKFSWAEMSEMIIDLLDTKATLTRRKNTLKNQLDFLKLLNPHLKPFSAIYEWFEDTVKEVRRWQKR